MGLPRDRMHTLSSMDSTCGNDRNQHRSFTPSSNQNTLVPFVTYL
jgi:hypothetical protein